MEERTIVVLLNTLDSDVVQTHSVMTAFQYYRGNSTGQSSENSSFDLVVMSGNLVITDCHSKDNISVQFTRNAVVSPHLISGCDIFTHGDRKGSKFSVFEIQLVTFTSFLRSCGRRTCLENVLTNITSLNTILTLI